MSRSLAVIAATLLCSCLAASPAPAQRHARKDASTRSPAYVRSEAMVPTRDGVKLHTVILRPAGSDKTGAPLPFLMERTPYGVDGADAASIAGAKPELAASDYIFIFQDIRGRYGSGGTFVMNRPVVAHTTKADVDETTDTRDTIDWLLKNVPNNAGKVGVLGISYPGFLAIMAGVDAHPAVKAVSPQAPMTDVWRGDDFFHNGAFRQTYGFDYVQELEAQKTDKRNDATEDQFDFFLRNVNFAGAAKTAGMTDLPTARRFLTEPGYTKFWSDMGVENRLAKPEVPTLEVGGYWDQEDMWGTQAEYAAMRPKEDPSDPNHKVFMVLGPWNHGGWAHGDLDRLTSPFGELSYGGQKPGEYYRTHFEAPFFELYLKGKPGFDLEDTASFRTGENRWHSYPVWPPQTGATMGYEAAKLYLEPSNQLSFTAPSADSPVAAYVADPADPVPYRHRPVQSTYGEGSHWRQWLVEDQRFVTTRKDVATFTMPLGADLTITGDVLADLFASTTGSDADWVVKLIDVYPDDPALGQQSGYQLMVADEILRGRYRNSLSTPEPVTPGQPTEYKWSLHGVDHTFLRGHKLMVEVQSSWFPLYDRNPQTFVPNIMTAPASAYQAETITIHSGPKFPSRLEFPVATP